MQEILKSILSQCIVIDMRAIFLIIGMMPNLFSMQATGVGGVATNKGGVAIALQVCNIRIRMPCS